MMVVPKAFVLESEADVFLLDALFPELEALASFYVEEEAPLGPLAQSILIREGTPVILVVNARRRSAEAANELRELYRAAMGYFAHESSYEAVMIAPDLASVVADALRQVGRTPPSDDKDSERLSDLLHSLSMGELGRVRSHPQIRKLVQAVQRLEAENIEYWTEELEEQPLTPAV
jgi:hypothetical protein